MPIFRVATKLVYFAHVPKCGGSSVNAYMTERFGPPAFIDRRFMRERERLLAEGWYRSSPQHIPAEWLSRLFPRGFFDAMFATVRHPVDRAIFDAYVETQLAPALRPGDVVIMENLSSHKSQQAEKAVRARGAWLLFLPPYSPDLNPIEMAFSKLKAHLRSTAARTIDDLWKAIGNICTLFTPDECSNYFSAAGNGLK